MIRQQADLQPPRELLSFVERQIRNAPRHTGPERRSENRYLMAVPVLVQPVDKKHNPIGDAFAAVTRDISPTAIGLVHTEEVAHRLLAIQMRLADELVNVIVELLWCEPLGPFEYLGARFVAKLDSFPRNGNDATDLGALGDRSPKSLPPSTRPSARFDRKPNGNRNSTAPSIPCCAGGSREATVASRTTDPSAESSDRAPKDGRAGLPAVD
jgi:hypothetical protein